MRAEGELLAEAALGLMRRFPAEASHDPKACVFGQTAAGLFARLGEGDPAEGDPAEGDRAGYASRLATTLYELSLVLQRLDRADQTLDTANESCGIWRKLAADVPLGTDAFAYDRALGHLHRLHRDRERPDLAAEVSTEWVGFHRRQSATVPTWPPLIRAPALMHHGEDLLLLDRYAEAVPPLREAADLYRPKVAEDPDTWEPVYASTLDSLHQALRKTAQREEAVAVAAEIVPILRRFAGEDPDGDGAYFASFTSDHGFLLSSLGRHAEALAATAEAVRARRSLPATTPAALAFTLWTFAEVRLAARGELPDAAEAIAEAVAIYQDLAETEPDRHGDHLRQVLTMATDIAAAWRGSS